MEKAQAPANTPAPEVSEATPLEEPVALPTGKLKVTSKKDGKNTIYSATWDGEPSKTLSVNLDFSKSKNLAILEPKTSGLKLTASVPGSFLHAPPSFLSISTPVYSLQ